MPAVKKPQARRVLKGSLPKRVGFLPPDEFESIGKAAFGNYGWQATLQRGTDWAPSTIQRYLRGQYPIPKHVKVLMQAIVTLKQAGLPIPEEFSAEYAVTKTDTE